MLLAIRKGSHIPDKLCIEHIWGHSVSNPDSVVDLADDVDY